MQIRPDKRGKSLAGSGIELNKKFFKFVSWYDNKWSYRCRSVELLQKIGKSLK